MSAISTGATWQTLPLAEWRETYETLHLWTQIVGKVRLALTPWLNHSWHVTLYGASLSDVVSARPDWMGWTVGRDGRIARVIQQAS